MQVAPVSNVLYSQHENNGTNNVMNKDSFLRLLVAQLKYQNPLQPQDNEAFITQLVQFSIIEQLYNMTEKMSQVAESVEFNKAVTLIGHEVVVKDAQGNELSGKVEKAGLVKGKVTLYIGGKEYDLQQLIEVR